MPCRGRKSKKYSFWVYSYSSKIIISCCEFWNNRGTRISISLYIYIYIYIKRVPLVWPLSTPGSAILYCIERKRELFSNVEIYMENIISNVTFKIRVHEERVSNWTVLCKFFCSVREKGKKIKISLFILCLKFCALWERWGRGAEILFNKI